MKRALLMFPRVSQSRQTLFPFSLMRDCIQPENAALIISLIGKGGVPQSAACAYAIMINTNGEFNLLFLTMTLILQAPCS